MARKTGRKRKGGGGSPSSAREGGLLSRKTKAFLVLVGLLICAVATSQKYLRPLASGAAGGVLGESPRQTSEEQATAAAALLEAPSPAAPSPAAVHLRGKGSEETAAAAPSLQSVTAAPPPATVAPATVAPVVKPGPAHAAMPDLAESQRFNENCEYMEGNPQSSRPGRPCLPPAWKWPWATTTEWRTHLGERILAAVSPKITEEKCGGFDLFGDQTWCKKAFGPQGTLGLSYGIEERDLWSETFSGQFGVSTWLFDCFIPLERSPPMQGTAPNATGPGNCKGMIQKAQGHCYESPYRPVRACLAAEEGAIEGRQYLTLESHLRGRGPLSTYVKIDVEGSEWAVLERLLTSDEDCGKIRSLDMEVHFDYKASSEAKFTKGKSDKDIIDREVSIMEGLLKHFEVTGSTLEVYRQGWTPDRDCPKQECKEPPLHTAGGFSLRQFAVSYVNRKLL